MHPIEPARRAAAGLAAVVNAIHTGAQRMSLAATAPRLPIGEPSTATISSGSMGPGSGSKQPPARRDDRGQRSAIRRDVRPLTATALAGRGRTIAGLSPVKDGHP